jgi:translation elongation factor EF-4
MGRKITNEELNKNFKKFGFHFINYKTVITSLDNLYRFLPVVCKYDTLLIARKSVSLKRFIKGEEEIRIIITHNPTIYVESTPMNLIKISQILNEILTGIPPPSERDAKGLKRWVLKKE